MCLFVSSSLFEDFFLFFFLMRSKNYLASDPLTQYGSNVRQCTEVFDKLKKYRYVRNPTAMIISGEGCF